MTDIRQRTDGELLYQFANTGSEEAFAELVGRHGPMVHGVCRRVLADHHEAQDVAQAVFLTLARKAGSMRKDPSVGGWLQHVALCLARNVRESRLSREKRESKAMSEDAQVETSTVESQEFRTEVDAAVATLPERYRLPVVLFHLEERSLDETARQLDLNVSTAGNRLARAREMLRKKLVRRGVTVGSVGALTTLLSAEAGAAVLPATFISATVKAAGLAAAGKLAAGVGAGAISANVATLTKGAVNMLFWSSVKTAVVAVAVTGVVVGTGTVVAQKAMEATPVATVASKSKIMDLPSLIRLRREQNLLTGEWICPTNPAGLGNFETVNPRLGWSVSGTQGGQGSFYLYGTNTAERTGSGIYHFTMRANADNSNFWVMVMYGTKAPIACIEYIQHANELRLIRTIWTADGRLDPDKHLNVRTGPNIEELKSKAGDDLRNYLAPVLAMITPEDLLGATNTAEQDTPATRKVKVGIQDGQKLLRDGKFQEAIAAFEATGGMATGQSDEMNAEILFWKAESCRKAGNTNNAITVLRDLLQKYPKTRWAALAHGRLVEMTQKTSRIGNQDSDLPKGAATVSATAPAVLCGNTICAQKVNMANGIHDCPNCRKVKTNLAHKFCPDCARQLSVCMICGKALGPGATALIDPFKSGDYASGKWSYHYIVVEKGPQTGYRQGFLKYDGREILSPQPNDYIATPWGWMQWHDRELKAGNWFRVEEPRGWKPGKDEFWPGTPREERMKYRLLPDPATHPEVLTNPPPGR